MKNTIENIIKESKLKKFYKSHQALGKHLDDGRISDETFRCMFTELITKTAKELNLTDIQVIDEFMKLKRKLRLAK